MTNEEPRFNAPYGGVIAQVTNPREHHGYRHMVAWHIELGATSRDYILRACAEAALDNAPADALHRNSASDPLRPGEWYRMEEFRTANPESAARVEKYAQAMHSYELERKAWNKARRTAVPTHEYTIAVPAVALVKVNAVSLKHALSHLQPAPGQENHQIRQMFPPVPGTVGLTFDSEGVELVSTTDPEHIKPAPVRRAPLAG
jgi:hypothetical protein